MSVLTVWRILAAGFLASLMFALAPGFGPDSGLPSPASASASVSGLMAPKSACPDNRAKGGPKVLASARRSMSCMINYARKRRQLRSYRVRGNLNWSATRKAGDLIRCNSFSHTACGRSFDYWIRRSGYVRPKRAWATAENIAWGSGSLGNVRAIFNAWLHSPGHRRAILDRQFTDLGIGISVGHMRGVSGARTWTLHFGLRG